MEKIIKISEGFLENELGLKVRRIKFKSNAELHSHDFYEVELVMSGGGEQILNGESYEMKRGSISILTPADFHEYSCFGEIEIMGIYFSEKLLSRNVMEKIFCRNYSPFLTLSEEKTKDALRLMENLESATGYEDYTKEALIKKLIDCLFDTVNTNAAANESKEEKTPIRLAKRYIEMHFRENPSLRDVATVAGKSPEYFSKYFYKNEGVYYTDYLNMQKVKCARFLLTESNMTVTDIGFEAGFTSFSNFLRVFKEMEGVNPAEYRKKHKT